MQRSLAQRIPTIPGKYTTKVYSGVGADIVMESISLIERVLSVNACLQQLAVFGRKVMAAFAASR
jgi:hypothetical protein